MNVLVINGPNLNMLGKREPETYGHLSLEQINADLTKYAKSLGININFVQSNAEHVLIDNIHSAFEKVDFIVINPGAFTHTSVALRDALLSVSIPFIEVHLSNVHARESFRQHSYLSDVAHGVICGLGAQGYEFAITAAKSFLSK
ncbi:type II 3-dehydroquinate dehydratase [Paraglaciecola aquimarina]|uniref:3-dehydroquinate dehydratase n=1 Tax=Paraglaciecola algarum TaxID=3050085 RepID=A0ABS9D930_9ALTE|nr:type II 3-dehydroquinate dehydratase [Paraglaciecola sp. G1-23]